MVAIFLIVPFGAARLSRLIAAWVRRHGQTRAAKLFRLAIPEPTVPTLWDWAAISGVLEGKFVVIEFADGRRIGGAHGPPGVSMTSPDQHGLYLALEWQLDQKGVPVQRLQDPAGVVCPLVLQSQSVRSL